jgi:hypothetical protein
VRAEPLSFVVGNEDYLPLLKRGLEHAHVTVQQLRGEGRWIAAALRASQ